MSCIMKQDEMYQTRCHLSDRMSWIRYYETKYCISDIMKQDVSCIRQDVMGQTGCHVSDVMKHDDMYQTGCHVSDIMKQGAVFQTS